MAAMAFTLAAAWPIAGIIFIFYLVISGIMYLHKERKREIDLLLHGIKHDEEQIEKAEKEIAWHKPLAEWDAHLSPGLPNKHQDEIEFLEHRWIPGLKKNIEQAKQKLREQYGVTV